MVTLPDGVSREPKARRAPNPLVNTGHDATRQAKSAPLLMYIVKDPHLIMDTSLRKLIAIVQRHESYCWVICIRRGVLLISFVCRGKGSTARVIRRKFVADDNF